MYVFLDKHCSFKKPSALSNSIEIKRNSTNSSSKQLIQKVENNYMNPLETIETSLSP